MLYAECFATPLTTIHRRRELSVPGIVHCRYGDYVSSDRIVAEAEMPMGYHLLDLESMLGTRIKDIKSALTKEIGDSVEQGEVIARIGRLFKRTCVSPVEGRLLDARRGKVLIESLPSHVDLTAFYSGKVVNVVLDRGVVIEATGALVQGVWGTGRQVRGRLECLVPNGQMTLNAGLVTEAHMGAILVGGRTLDKEVLAAAAHNQAAAIIVGSVSSRLLGAIEESGLSLILTEGFGDFAMNRSAFRVLESHSGQETCCSPTVQPRWETQRPEVFVPRTVSERPPSPGRATLEAGTRVRVLRAPYENAIGQVVGVPPQPRRLGSGALVRGAEVDLDSEGRAFVPLENLEIMC